MSARVRGLEGFVIGSIVGLTGTMTKKKENSASKVGVDAAAAKCWALKRLQTIAAELRMTCYSLF